MDTSRQPCKYFQQGACKYGSECLYSHDPATSRLAEPRPGRTGYRPKYPNMTLDNTFRTPEKKLPSHVPLSSSERRPGRANYKPKYEPSNNQGVKKGAKPGKGGKGRKNTSDPKRKSSIETRVTKKIENSQSNVITPEQVIQHDLSSYTLKWPFSCYGITSDWNIAGNIIEGVDYSQEELRLQALTEWKMSNGIQQYLTDVATLKQFVEQKRQLVLYNPTAALNDSIKRRTACATNPSASQHIMNASNTGHFSILQHNPTLSNGTASVSNYAMQDDHLGSFQLGSVPMEPPS